MSTTYQINDFYFRKDLVFGWCVMHPAKARGHWVPAEWMEAKDIEAYLPMLGSPLHRDIYDAFSKLITKKKADEVKEPVVPVPVDEMNRANDTGDTDRSKDRVKLFEEIHAKAEITNNETISADLGYVVVQHNTRIRRVIVDAVRPLDPMEGTQVFGTIRDAMDYILKKWW